MVGSNEARTGTLAAALLLATASCGARADGGEDTDATGGTGEDDPAMACESEVGVGYLRRLTAAQYRNTIRDLLGVESDMVAAFSPDERVGPTKPRRCIAGS